MVTLNPRLVQLPSLEKLRSLYQHFLNKRKARTQDKPQRSEIEEAVIFDLEEGMVWVAELPRTELIKHIERDARYVASTNPKKYLALGVGGAAGGTLGFVLGFLLGHIVLGVMFAFLFTLIGAPIGHKFLNEVFKPRPKWILFKSKDEKTKKVELLGIPHTRADGISAEEDVITPTMYYDIMEGRDLKDMFRAGMSGWQKLALGALVTLAISSMIALFLFVGAFGTGG